MKNKGRQIAEDLAGLLEGPGSKAMELAYPTAAARRAVLAEAGIERTSTGITVLNEADGVANPTVRIYGTIGGWFGVWADELADELDAIDAERITVRLFSPGGSVFEGVAIHSLIKNHKAKVDLFVDSLAASAGSFIAMAADRIVMTEGAEMMIHNAWAYAGGNAAELRDMADFLDRQSKKVAGFYQSRAGGDLDEWLAAMDAETWYDGDEAVAAGLADEVSTDTDDDDGDNSANRVDLSVFGYLYQGRGDAPGPSLKSSTSAAPGSAPDVPAASSAAGDGLAAVRQRLASVGAMAGAELALADPQ